MGRTPPVENELKWQLDAPGHRLIATRLHERWGRPRELVQLNRFFDTADGDLRAAGAALRLRRENGRLLLTCKRHISSEAGFHRHSEYERWLPSACFQPCIRGQIDPSEVIPLPEDILADIAGRELRCIGGFDNRRLAWSAEGEEVALDRTDFGTRIDRELEVETHHHQTSRRRWEARFAEWGLAPPVQDHSKLGRYLALVGTGARGPRPRPQGATSS